MAVRANVLHAISVTDCCHRVTTQLQVTNNNNNNNNNNFRILGTITVFFVFKVAPKLTLHQTEYNLYCRYIDCK